MPALIKVGIAHSQFETIHPFLDGNGRVGRLLITFLLCEKEILKRPLLYLSHYFKLNRIEYYDRLQAVRDRGDWEGWLKFFLQGVAQVAEEATLNARRIVIMREEHRDLILNRLGRASGKGLQLLERLYFRPIVSVQTAAEITGLSFANANSLAQPLETVGLPRETTGRKRNRRFSYQPYLSSFSEEQN